MVAFDQESPAEKLAAAVNKLAASPMIVVSGYAGTLKVLVAYLGEQQRRLVDVETRLKVLERCKREQESMQKEGRL